MSLDYQTVESLYSRISKIKLKMIFLASLMTTVTSGWPDAVW